MTDAPCVVLLHEGASAFEATGALAALHAAGRAAHLVAREALVRSREGVRLVPARLGFDDLPHAPAVIAPSGAASVALADADLVRALRARRGAWSLFAGDAARLAHAAGLAEGRRMARLPGEPAIPGTTSAGSRLVADGRLLTCSGGDAIVDLTLHLVAMLDGHERAAQAAAILGREHRPFAFGETGEEAHAGR